MQVNEFKCENERTYETTTKYYLFFLLFVVFGFASVFKSDEPNAILFLLVERLTLERNKEARLLLYSYAEIGLLLC